MALSNDVRERLVEAPVPGRGRAVRGERVERRAVRPAVPAHISFSRSSASVMSGVSATVARMNPAWRCPWTADEAMDEGFWPA